MGWGDQRAQLNICPLFLVGLAVCPFAFTPSTLHSGDGGEGLLWLGVTVRVEGAMFGDPAPSLVPRASGRICRTGCACC